MAVRPPPGTGPYGGALPGAPASPSLRVHGTRPGPTCTRAQVSGNLEAGPFPRCVPTRGMTRWFSHRGGCPSSRCLGRGPVWVGGTLLCTENQHREGAAIAEPLSDREGLRPAAI